MWSSTKVWSQNKDCRCWHCPMENPICIQLISNPGKFEIFLIQKRISIDIRFFVCRLQLGDSADTVVCNSFQKMRQNIFRTHDRAENGLPLHNLQTHRYVEEQFFEIFAHFFNILSFKFYLDFLKNFPKICPEFFLKFWKNFLLKIFIICTKVVRKLPLSTFQFFFLNLITLTFAQVFFKFAQNFLW